MMRDKYLAIYVLIMSAVFFSGLTSGKLANDNMVTVLYFELVIIFLCVTSLALNVQRLRFLKQHLFVLCMAFVLLVVLLIYFNFTIAVNIYIFLVLYACLCRDLNPYFELCKHNKILTVLVVLWLLSISISFFASPFGLINSYLSRVRYEQTIVHLVCFISLIVFSRISQFKLDKVLLAVSVSICLVGLFSIYLYFSLDPGEISSSKWKFSPPFSINVRNLGYQVMVGLIVLLSYLPIAMSQTMSREGRYIRWLLFSGMIFLWGFLFWLGGRSSIVATFIVVLILWFVLFLKGKGHWVFLKLSVISSILGAVISEWISVFPWNGLFKNVDRAITTTIQMQVPGRVNIWDAVWTAVNEHVFFGLGARAFSFIPYDGGWMTHPHNIFFQFLGEWGIIGGTLFIALLSAAFIRGFKLHILNYSADRSAHSLVGGMVIIGLTLHSLTDGTYYYAQPVLNLVIAFAVWVTPAYADFAERNVVKASIDSDVRARPYNRVKKSGIDT